MRWLELRRGARGCAFSPARGLLLKRRPSRTVLARARTSAAVAPTLRGKVPRFSVSLTDTQRKRCLLTGLPTTLTPPKSNLTFSRENKKEQRVRHVAQEGGGVGWGGCARPPPAGAGVRETTGGPSHSMHAGSASKGGPLCLGGHRQGSVGGGGKEGQGGGGNGADVRCGRHRVRRH